MKEREQLIIDEGIRLKPYKCSKGKITIGIGRNLEGNPLTPDECMTMLLARPHIKVNNTEIKLLRQMLLNDFYENGITQQEAFYLFDNDLRKVKEQLFSAFPWLHTHNEEVQNILFNMCFQMGITKLRTFKKTLRHIQDGNHKLAAAEMRDSDWYKQTTNRANRLIERMKRI